MALCPTSLDAHQAPRDLHCSFSLPYNQAVIQNMTAQDLKRPLQSIEKDISAMQSQALKS